MKVISLFQQYKASSSQPAHLTELYTGLPASNTHYDIPKNDNGQLQNRKWTSRFIQNQSSIRYQSCQKRMFEALKNTFKPVKYRYFFLLTIDQTDSK